MGVPYLCQHSVYCDFSNGSESIGSFKDLQSLDSTDVLLGSRKAHDMRFDEMCSCRGSLLTPDGLSGVNPSSPKHEAAVKLQKVYKSFRTRRKLADRAVLIEPSWWKLLDFAELKHSSVSFFGLDKRETAISRWSRARTRAAKVGKGLSKNGKAQKLALQHWLEAIDPRHRYGHNLHFYYVKWLNSQSMEPFFYWLDIGEGKEVNLLDKCPRWKLQQQCIKYLGPLERQAYEVVVEDGQLFYKQTGEPLNTSKEPKGSKWIFVLSTSRTLYVGKKKKGSFQHSSFLAGGATLAAGRIIAENGVLKAVWPHSGHYRPTPENFQDLLSFLRDNNVDLTGVKLESTDEEEEESDRNKRAIYLRSNSFADESAESDGAKRGEEAATTMQKSESEGFSRKPAALEMPSNKFLPDQVLSETQIDEPSTNGSQVATTSEDSSAISDQELKSCQSPAKQVSCKWNSAAATQTSHLRDYSSNLQCHALERADVSPRSKYHLRLDIPQREPTTTGTYFSCSSSCHYSLQSSSVNRSLSYMSCSTPVSIL